MFYVCLIFLYFLLSFFLSIQNVYYWSLQPLYATRASILAMTFEGPLNSN